MDGLPVIFASSGKAPVVGSPASQMECGEVVVVEMQGRVSRMWRVKTARMSAAFGVLGLLARLFPISALAQLAAGGKLLPSVPSPLAGSAAPVAIDGDLAVAGTEECICG